MIRLEEIEKIPLIDTHMHRVHPARAPEWGSLGGGYIPGPGQERHGRQTVLYGMILEKLRQRFGMAEDASPEEVERERFLRYGKDPKGYYADLIGECNVAICLFQCCVDDTLSARTDCCCRRHRPFAVRHCHAGRGGKPSG